MGGSAVFFVDTTRLSHDKILIMSKGKSDKTIYKPYDQGQAYLIPPSAEGLIPENHLVRLVSETIDDRGIERLVRKCLAGGEASRYHPVMMTKVCSSRMLAKAMRENIMFRCGG
jgi:transposase